ncbi:conjugal transfer protein MobB [Elizabethkingia miricola]|uniref:conjugal transfer protein MobB n=1 Tax=Elizabethkingia miricola TaxID=172045 RepID=UPI003892B380
MIAKIGRGSNLFGSLSYNNLKIEKDQGEILLTNKIIETENGKYTVAQLVKSFEPYLLANRNTEKHTIHISLNPDPNDRVSDEQYRGIAEQYVKDMGYGDQPFVVFKHTDIDRSHIHIVSLCVDEEGKKISDKFEKVRSMKACRDLEKKFGLISALEKKSSEDNHIFKPVNYIKGDVKSQIASVVRHLPSHYQFQSLGEYNALLSLYNITAEKVEGELHGKSKKGLLYFPLDSQGKKISNPFKASLFGKKPGIDSLEKHIAYCKSTMKNYAQKEELKKNIAWVLQSTKSEHEFKEKLSNAGIKTVVRKNDNGRIYGITFIDHQTKTVWNGSRLGKELSANAFNDKWNVEDIHTSKNIISSTHGFPYQNSEATVTDFFDVNKSEEFSLMDSSVGILPEFQSEDHQEIEFANQIRKRKKRNRRK